MVKPTAMGTVLLAGLVFIGLLLALALFARGGPTETIRAQGLPPELSGLANLELAELGSVAQRLFSEMGFAVRAQSQHEGRVDLIVEDPTPVTGQRAYVRCVLTPPAGAVESAEVQAALDTARGESLAKAVVVTPGTFSDEARLLSKASALELIDGVKLSELLRAHLPDVANRLGIPR